MLSSFMLCSLSAVVTDMLDNAHRELETMISNCKTLVRHFKHAALQSRLKKTLKQECPTRWNSVYTMLESIITQYDDIHEILAVLERQYPVGHFSQNCFKLQIESSVYQRHHQPASVCLVWLAVP